MPLDLEPPDSAVAPTPNRIVGGASAIIEVSGLFCSVHRNELEIPVRLIERANGIWGDGVGTLTEPVVLAHAAGVLNEPDLAPVLAHLAEPITFDHPLALETEVPGERDLTNARLARLARDSRLRRRFVTVLGELWEAFSERWTTERAQIDATRDAWQRRIDAGEDVVHLLPPRHLVRRDDHYAQMARTAARAGTLQLTPSLTARHIIAMPGLVSIGARAEHEDAIVSRRRVADEIAAQLRPLADATRITILTQLASAPAGVSELARALHIAQPTASVHLRQLRDAGLVESRRDGARNVYHVRPEALDHLLVDVRERLGAAATLSGNQPSSNRPGTVR